MKNFLSTENFVLSSHESLREIIQSSSEMEEFPITNILESEDKTIWLSTEELPQEITINLSKHFFKEFPKKISAIGIYCWHAYPTNPKLIEVQISKNKGKIFTSLGNFDLCLKPGRQLLQLEDDSECIDTKDINSNDLIIKLIIKETFGDKRTYINNIYLYEDLNMCGKKFLTSMEPIKEEDSNSMIYLRESRERAMPKSAIKSNKKSLIDKSSNLKDLLEIDFDAKSEENYKNNKNENKILGIESEFLMSDSEFSEKYNNSNNKENDLFNDKKKDEIKTNKTEIINNKEELNKDLKDNNKNNIKNNERYTTEKAMNDKSKVNKNINKEEPHEVEEKEKSLNINDFNDDEENESHNDNNNNNNINDEQLNNNNSQNDMEKDIDEQSSNSYREEDLNLLIDEFENYKKMQMQKVKNYEKKLNYLENQFKEMTYLSNNMKNRINTILGNQLKQKRINQDYLLNNMRKIINERITKVFSNFNKFSNFYSPPLYAMGNENYIPNYQYNYNYNYNTIGNPNSNNGDINYFGGNKNLIRNKTKSEKKKLKQNKNLVIGRNKSGQKMSNRINNNNYFNIDNSSRNYLDNKDQNLLLNDNTYNILNGGYNNENYLENYHSKYGFYRDNNIHNVPFFKKNQNLRTTFNDYNNNNNINFNNKNIPNRFNTDNNEFVLNNMTERINNKKKFSNNQHYTNLKHNNYNSNSNSNIQDEYSSSNNEIEQLFTEFRNNLGQKISEKILKPSISKIENYMKGNLREVKNAFQNKDINQKNIKKKQSFKGSKENNDIKNLK